MGSNSVSAKGEWAINRIDARLNGDAMQMLQSMVGEILEKYSYGPFEDSSLSFGFVALYFDGNAFKFENYFESQNFFGHIDDVAILKLHPAIDAESMSGLMGGQMFDTPHCMQDQANSRRR